MSSSFSIAHVTPYPWEAEDNEVNAHVARVAAELSRRGPSRPDPGALALPGARPRLTARAARGPRLRARRGGPAGGHGPGRPARPRRRRGARRRARRPAAPGGAADRRRPHRRGTAGDGRPGLRPRARAVRAQHLRGRPAALAGAERRFVPLLGGATALDAARPPLRGELLRASRRAGGQPAGDGRADGPPLPRRLPPDRRRRRSGGGAGARLRRAGRPSPQHRGRP